MNPKEVNEAFRDNMARSRTSDTNLRLRCLELAASVMRDGNSRGVVPLAQELFEFVTSAGSPEK